MVKISIPKTQKMPGVEFDPKTGKLEIIGNSIPEDAGSFYKPILDAFNDYIKTPQPQTVISINLIYFNTSSSKWLINLLKLAKAAEKENTKVEINWYYDEGDEDMRDTIKDYQSMLQLPINILKA